MNCQSCGMPMDKPEDHGGGRPDNLYCKYCTDPSGNLLPRETVRQNMIQFYIQKMGKTPDEAVIEVDKIMATMPAWQVGVPPTTPVEPTPPVSEPPMPPAPEPTTVEPAPTETPVSEPPSIEPAAEPTTEEPPPAKPEELPTE